MNDLGNFVSRKTLAAYLSVTIQTIRNWEREGMPVVHLGKSKLPRYSVLDVMQWVHSQDDKSMGGDK